MEAEIWTRIWSSAWTTTRLCCPHWTSSQSCIAIISWRRKGFVGHVSSGRCNKRRVGGLMPGCFSSTCCGIILGENSHSHRLMFSTRFDVRSAKTPGGVWLERFILILILLNVVAFSAQTMKDFRLPNKVSCLFIFVSLSAFPSISLYQCFAAVGSLRDLQCCGLQSGIRGEALGCTGRSRVLSASRDNLVAIQSETSVFL